MLEFEWEFTPEGKYRQHMPSNTNKLVIEDFDPLINNGSYRITASSHFGTVKVPWHKRIIIPSVQFSDILRIQSKRFSKFIGLFSFCSLFLSKAFRKVSFTSGKSFSRVCSGFRNDLGRCSQGWPTNHILKGSPDSEGGREGMKTLVTL